jgi:CubicO group peptidase (beta-lactamase class C family)
VAAAADTLAPITSLLVWQGDTLTLRRTWRGMSTERPVNIKSASKSILGLLAGFAVTDGHLALDAPVARFFPEVFGDSTGDPAAIVTDEAKRAITVRDLLTMRAGLESTSFGNYGSWVTTDDWARDALTRPLVGTPGNGMIYSTGTTHLLGRVLARATGQSLRAYAEDRLFGPLGIRAGAWQRDPQGHYFGGNNLALSPEALLDLGRLVLARGTWRGERLLPPGWIVLMTYPHVTESYRNFHYGFLWWIETFGDGVRGEDGPGGATTYFAWGYGGQFVFVTPELDLVVALTSSLNPEARTRGHTGRVFRFMDETLVPAARRAAARRRPPP